MNAKTCCQTLVVIGCVLLFLSCQPTAPEQPLVTFDLQLPKTIKIGTSVQLTGRIIFSEAFHTDTVSLVVYHDSVKSLGFSQCVDLLHVKGRPIDPASYDTIGISYSYVQTLDSLQNALLSFFALQYKLGQLLVLPNNDVIEMGKDIEYGIIVGENALPGQYGLHFNVDTREGEHFNEYFSFSIIK